MTFLATSDIFKHALEAEKCRRSLAHFVRRAWKTVDPAMKLRWNWHLDAICEHLEAVTRREIKKLIINIPPGHAKSLLVSVFWFSWEWSHTPSEQGLYGSYDEGLVLRDSNRARNLIRSPWYQNTFEPEWIIRRNQDAANYFVNTANGSRKGFYMGGKSKLGWRGNKIVVDDPIASDERFNPAVKQHAYDTFTKVLSTRVNDPTNAVFLLIMQRLAADDLAGRLIDNSLGFDVLRLPSRYIAAKPCSTSIGWSDPRTEDKEPLFPQMFPESYLAEQEEKVMLPDDFSAQHQQEPIKESGGRFNPDWYRYWTWVTDREFNSPIVYLHKPHGVTQIIQLQLCWTFVSVDLAASEKQRADYTVMLTWAVTPYNDCLLVGRYKDRVDEPKIIDAAKRIYSEKNWAHEYHNFFVIEDNGLGLPIAQDMMKEGIPVITVHKNKDKFVGSTCAAVRTHAGQIYFPQRDYAPWVDDFKKNLTEFPLAEHDDDVDAYSLGAIAVYEGVAGVITNSEGVRLDGQRPEPDKDVEERMKEFKRKFGLAAS